MYYKLCLTVCSYIILIKRFTLIQLCRLPASSILCFHMLTVRLPLTEANNRVCLLLVSYYIVNVPSQKMFSFTICSENDVLHVAKWHQGFSWGYWWDLCTCPLKYFDFHPWLLFSSLLGMIVQHLFISRFTIVTISLNTIEWIINIKQL